MEREPRPKQDAYVDVGDLEIPSESTTLTSPTAVLWRGAVNATTSVYVCVVRYRPIMLRVLSSSSTGNVSWSS